VKILAIRGCNLASLAGEFEIDLANGPLGVAGVFAIVGPTGAGKSTLLDAMCVALFDRTPRLPGHSRVIVGHGDEDPLALGSQDPRTLLRRGASQGWAEVDFESGDARRYRARWSVRRARGATDGHLQDQQVTFMALDEHSVMSERLGGTKTETLKAIHQRLGLTFDQFRRSALLAQGDFAAFLRAEGKDRSELLERMTGTEIYSKLSIAAHMRAVLAVEALKEKQAVALAIAVLDPDARAATSSDLDLAKLACENARDRHADAEKLAQWRAEAESRSASLAQTQTELGLAEAEARGAEPLRSELELRRRAEALRGVWDEAARVDRQHSIAQGDLARAVTAATAATVAKAETAATRARIADLHATIRAARMAAGIVELEATMPPPFGSLELAERTAHAALEAAVWLVERKMLGSEISSWPELEAKLAQERVFVDGIAAADRSLQDHAAQHAALAAKAAAAEQARGEAQQKLAEAQRESESFVKRRTLGLDAAGRAEDGARAMCAEVERLVTISSGARAAANVLTELESRLRDLEIEATADRERRANGERDRDAAAVLRDERARVVAELRKAAGYQHARAELVAGDPCPLCGADEHPWKHRGAFDELIANADGSLAEAVQRWEAATKLIAQLDARDVQRDGELLRFASTRVTAQTSVEALARDWRVQLAALGELSLVTNPAEPAAERLAIERTEDARVRLEAVRATRSAAEAAHKAIAEAQAREKVCQSDLDHHLTDLRELAASLASLTVAVERVTGERANRIERHADLTSELAAALARWSAALPATDREQLGLSTVAVSSREHALRIALSAWIASLATKRFGELVQMWRERATAVGAAELGLIGALAEIDRAELVAERAVADTAARHAECAKRSRELAAELVTATTALDAARTAAGFDREALHRALADDASRVETLAAEIDRLKLAVDRASTRLAERQRLVTDHDTAKPTPRVEPGAKAEALRAAVNARSQTKTVDEEPPLDDIARARAERAAKTEATRATHDDAMSAARDRVELDADRVPELAIAVKDADERAAKLAASLAADDDARRRRDAALVSFAAAERAAEVDRVLGEVIGSHDGKLFRSFAQSLTLDQLLFVANSHLEELAPRYQLERVPKHDLELQVIDRDFGSEVRSVQSLSGGESFLVSLALALGLSSMSAHDVRVRTLLIDEGFGTLDPATLDSALAVLDELQATGRQVGIISHVPALLDRVRAHVRVTPRGGGRSDVFIPPN
jgi:DNA repair protein SbcC/Rad50